MNSRKFDGWHHTDMALGSAKPSNFGVGGNYQAMGTTSIFKDIPPSSLSSSPVATSILTICNQHNGITLME